MTATRKTLLDTELHPENGTCPAHGRLVDVLLSLDSRLLRLELLLVATLLVSLGGPLKDWVMPLVSKAFGG